MQSENPSALYSKEALSNALIELIKEKPYNQITIMELTKRADLGRRTFYRHFNSKDEILAHIIKKMGGEFNDALLKAKGSGIYELQVRDAALIKTQGLGAYEIAEIFFTVCYANISFLLDLHKQRLMTFLFYEINRLLPLIRGSVVTDESEAKQFEEEHREKISYILYFQAGGFWSVLYKWLEDGAKKSPQEMARMVSSIISNFI